MVAAYRKGEPTKKANVFTQENVNNFLFNWDSTNKYVLVRKAAFVINLAGGLRGCELRPLKQSSLKEVATGLQLSYQSSKPISDDNEHKLIE